MLINSANSDTRTGWTYEIRVSMAALSFLLAAASLASAQSAAPARKCSKTRSRNTIETVASKLISNDEKTVFAAVDELGNICHTSVVAKLSRFIREGQPDAVTDHVLETLGEIGSSDASDVLKEFTNHRRPNARRLAYRALAAIRDPSTTELLSQGLRDTHPEVRATTALLLGEIGSKRQIEVLFWAFSRGVSEAAVAIGQLGDATSVERFTQYLERKPLAVMLSGYEQFLIRDDLAEKDKLKIVTALGEVAGPLVREFLSRILAREKRARPSALVRAIRATIRRIPSNQTPVEKRPNEKSRNGS